MSRAPTLMALAGLYIAQGLPYGFFTQAMPVLLRQQDVSLEVIGLSTLLAAPWFGKALWAPLVDALPRRGTLRALQVGTVMALVGVSALPPHHLATLAAAILVVNTLCATQDIATDGLAVTTLGEQDRGWGNALQVGGYRGGMILSGGALLAAADGLGWTRTWLALAALVALASLPTLFLPAAPPVTPPAGNPWSWLALPGALAWCAVLFTFKFGDYVGATMLRPWLVDQGVPTSALGLLLGVGGFTAGLVGALVGGAAVPRLGLRRALLAGGALQVTGVAAYAMASADLMPVLPAVLWEHAVGGVATTTLFTAMMAASRVERAGTDYTLQASVVVIASTAGAACSGFVASQAGYTRTFALGALLATAGPLLAASRAGALALSPARAA